MRLKLARPVLKPALDDDLSLREEFHRVLALAVQIAKETFLPAAKGEKRHRRSYANVDANVARFGFGAKLAGGCAAAGKQAGHVAPVAAVDQGDRLFDGFHMQQPQHRAEDFCLGWASARLDDALTWLPCRLTVLTIALLSGRPRHVLKLCRRDAPQDPSPNAGWSECAYAAALDVQVGGQNTYRGKVTQKPFLADPVRPITPERVKQALALTRRVFLLWLGLAITLHHLSFFRPLLS